VVKSSVWDYSFNACGFDITMDRNDDWYICSAYGLWSLISVFDLAFTFSHLAETQQESPKVLVPQRTLLSKTLKK